MFTVYVYTPDTLADWEIGYVTAELHSRRFFKKDAPDVLVKMVGLSKDPVQTMGGFTILPDHDLDDMVVNKNNVLVLPGSGAWDDPKHNRMIAKAKDFLAAGAMVCAICGATAALANAGLLDRRPHTSNGPGYLKMFAPDYNGQQFYVDKPSVADQNLITASSTGALLWAKQIIERLDVFQPDTLQSWYSYFSTGREEDFFALMQTLSTGG